MLDVKIIGNADCHFEIKSCTARRIPVIDEYDPAIDQEYLPMPLTIGN
jgi:hypothetical protein